MKEQTTNEVFLHFADKETERKFVKEYDCENRIFFRIGIYLSCVAWFIYYLGIYFSYHDIFKKALIVLFSILFVPFTIVVTLSFFKKYSTFNHHLTAFCNWAAA